MNLNASCKLTPLAWRKDGRDDGSRKQQCEYAKQNRLNESKWFSGRRDEAVRPRGRFSCLVVDAIGDDDLDTFPIVITSNSDEFSELATVILRMGFEFKDLNPSGSFDRHQLHILKSDATSAIAVLRQVLPDFLFCDFIAKHIGLLLTASYSGLPHRVAQTSVRLKENKK